MPEGKETIPSGTGVTIAPWLGIIRPIRVRPKIVINNAPLTFLIVRNVINASPPITIKDAGAFRSPIDTSVASWAMTIPTLFKPMNAMKKPIPH